MGRPHGGGWLAIPLPGYLPCIPFIRLTFFQGSAGCQAKCNTLLMNSIGERKPRHFHCLPSEGSTRTLTIRYNATIQYVLLW